MRLRRAVPQALELARATWTGARHCGVHPVEGLRILRRARRDGAWDYGEALGVGFLSPGCTDEGRRALVSRHRRQAAQTRHNPLALEPLTENKAICDRYLAAAGIRGAELHGTVGRHGGWCARTGAPIADGEDFAAFAARLPSEVIVKPAEGLYGLGVRRVRRVAGGMIDAGDGPVDPRELYDALAADPDFDLFVVQERLRNHPAIEALTGSETLQTLRISTFVRRDGGVHLMGAMMKLAVGSGPADNFRSGDTGNGIADVDLRTGRLGLLQLPTGSGTGCTTTPVVPGTDRRVEGFVVPFLEEACALVRAGAPHFLPMRTLGWDIGITPDGPAVVETNNYWGTAFTPLDPASRELLLST